MKKLNDKDVEILNKMLKKEEKQLIDVYRKSQARTTLFPNRTTFFATSNPGFIKPAEKQENKGGVK